MATDRLRFFPFYADAWLEDPAVIAMSAEAEGCYIRLLARSWKSKTPGVIQAGLVPEMCGLHRVKESERERVLQEIEGAFSVSENAWVQRRMVAESRHADYVYRSRVSAADKTNEAKSVARSPSRSPSRQPGVDLDLEVDLEESKTKKESKPRVAVAPVVLPDWFPEKLFSDFVESRKRHPMTPRAKELFVARVSKFREKGFDPRELVEAAIESGWRTVYPPTNGHANGNGVVLAAAPEVVATCHRCRAKFGKDRGSVRTLCPQCHAEEP